MTRTPAIGRHADFAEIAATEWNALAARGATNTVFQTWQWHQAWWQTCGGSDELLLLSAREDDRLVGVVAGRIDRDGIVRFVGDHGSDYADLLCPAAAATTREALWRGLLQHAGRWRRVVLRQLPATSPTVTNVLAPDLRTTETPEEPCPALRVDAPAVLTQVRAKKSLRRHHNWFRRQPEARVEHLCDAAAILPHLDEFFAQHRRRWSGTPSPSLFESAEKRDLYRALTQQLGPTGQLRFTRLSILGEACACHFGFVHDGTLLWYKPSFDIALARHSPGEALLAELLDLVAREQLRELDFSVGDEPFKRRFTNQVRYNRCLTVHAGWFDYQRTRAIAAGKSLLRPMVTRLRRRLGSA